MAGYLSRSEAYAENVVKQWQSMPVGQVAWRNAGSGTGVRTWGLTEDGLPMGAQAYVRIDTSQATTADIENCVCQDQVPLSVGELHTIGCYARGRGRLDIGPTQDGYAHILTVDVDHADWRYYEGTFTASSAVQSIYWRNRSKPADACAGALEICAPLVVCGGVLPLVVATAEVTLANDVEVGGRNLYRKDSAVRALVDCTVGAYDESIHGVEATATASNGSIRIHNVIDESNVPYTVSFKLTAPAATTVAIDIMDNTVQTFAVPAGESRVECTSVPTREVTDVYHFVDIVFGDAGTYTLADIKLERGNIATDWTPAPEDVEAGIEGAKSAADAAQSTADGAQATADGAQATADGAQATADGAQATADGAQATADGAQAAADGAQEYIDEHIPTATDGLHIYGRSTDYSALLSALGLEVRNGLGKSVALYGEEFRIGTTDKVHLLGTATRLAFHTAAGDIAYFGLDDKDVWSMFIEQANVRDMIRFGNYAWVKRPNGNMTIKYLED